MNISLLKNKKEILDNITITDFNNLTPARHEGKAHFYYNENDLIVTGLTFTEMTGNINSRDSIVDNTKTSDEEYMTNPDKILVRLDGTIYDLDISALTYTNIYYNNSIDTPHILISNTNQNILTYTSYNLNVLNVVSASYSNPQTVIVLNTNITLEEHIKSVDIYSDQVSLIMYDPAVQNFIHNIYNINNSQYTTHRHTSLFSYTRILDNGELIYYDSKEQTINIASDFDNQNSVYIPELPILDGVDYDIYISRSGIVMYYSLGKIYVLDLRNPDVGNTNGLNDISTLVYTNGLVVDDIKVPIAFSGRNFVFTHDGSSYKTPIGTFISDAGYFISNHYIDFNYDSNGIVYNSEIYYYHSIVFNPDVLYDHINMGLLYKNYNPLIPPSNRATAFIEPSSKYTIYIDSLNITDLSLSFNFSGGQTYQIDIPNITNLEDNLAYIDFAIEFPGFVVDDIKNSEYVELTPSYGNVLTQSLNLIIYN